jgi:arylsulfatase A
MNINRRTFLGGMASATSSVWAQNRKPNIVWIMADDLGVGDLGCYGQTKIATPHIDRLSREGKRFTSAYAGCTVCAPSRSVLMTGLHTGHTPVRANSGGVPLLPDEVTVAAKLQDAGYRTGMFGKWGLGDINSSGAPEKQGFDEYCGYLHQVHAHWFYPEFLYRNGKRLALEGNAEGKRTTYSHDVIEHHALNFIKSSKDKPFFAYLPFTLPHVELLVTEDYLKRYRGKFPERPYIDTKKHLADQPESRAAYAGMVSRLDASVGLVLDAIAANGADRDTIVFFTSDNGGATRLWGEEYFDSTAGLRGHKQNMYEGGLRVPLLARWPSRIRAGSTSYFPFSFQDFYPTALELAGRPSPSGLDGVSVMPEMLARAGQKQHPYLYWELPRFNRQKNSFADEIPMQALRQENWKVVRPQANARLELYDLQADPKEQIDLAEKQPERLAQLEKMLAAARVPPRPQREEDRDGWWDK